MVSECGSVGELTLRWSLFSGDEVRFLLVFWFQEASHCSRRIIQLFCFCCCSCLLKFDLTPEILKRLLFVSFDPGFSLSFFSKSCIGIPV